MELELTVKDILSMIILILPAYSLTSAMPLVCESASLLCFIMFKECMLSLSSP